VEQLSVSDAIRYVLVGFVAFFCYAFLFPDETSKLIDDIGALPLTGCATAGGAVFFFLYDALLLPGIHCFKDLIGSPEGNYRVRLKQRFPGYRLSCFEAEYVYVSLLRHNLKWQEVPDLAVLTSGIHLLYMSAVIIFLFAAGAEILSAAEKTTWALWLIAAVAFYAGLVLDRRAERTETGLLFEVDDSEILPKLKHAFPDRAPSMSEAPRAPMSTLQQPSETHRDIAVEWLRSAPLSELAPHLRIIADRVNDHRSNNNGFITTRAICTMPRARHDVRLH
jgi:hypothetical protein